MRDHRSRPPAPGTPRPAPGIPDSQVRALDRRLALSEQQRSYQGSVPRPHFGRTRPPG